MALDALISMRTAVVAAAVAATASTPFVLQSEAFGGKSHGSKEPARVVHGGVEFAVPRGWHGHAKSHGDHSADKHEAKHEADAAEPKHESLGNVDGMLCPRASGAKCADGMRVAFVTYAGGADASLPALEAFEAQLDAELPAAYPGFRRIESAIMPGADGTTYLSYTYVRRIGSATQQQRLAVYRHAGGSGVVAMATGSDVAKHAEQVAAIFASARIPLEPAAGGGGH